ncbi:MAG: cell division protein FtsQ/DivIB [Paracoccaceae bacterium]|nr:cell division protein FtsQ/DivIB [Paracoccaceae bacterium]MDE3123048.1 cell division protein FtsQ/DivIB [Paracoccaceae bacterium]MDE3238295.1 cell division protein FtsQ/DivIB [Paracoccaceae bacterium]
MTVHRRDPAPSRFSYRMQRLWLTPTFRFLVRRGLPVLFVLLVLAVVFGSAARRQALLAQYNAVRTQIEHRPEFMLSMLSIEGASPTLADAVRKMLDIPFPVSSFDLDLKKLRAQIEALDAVASANVAVGPDGVLQVTITERQPVAVWRTADGLTLVDGTGHRVASLTKRDARADLPLVVGLGADQAIPQAMALLAAAGPIAPRVRALVRVGERRWDMVLDRHQRVLLPEADPVAALERVIALDQARHLFDRDILSVDMRLPDRPAVQLSPAAFAARQKALGLEAKTGAAKK